MLEDLARTQIAVILGIVTCEGTAAPCLVRLGRLRSHPSDVAHASWDCGAEEFGAEGSGQCADAMRPLQAVPSWLRRSM